MRTDMSVGYLRHIQACNMPVDEPFLPWRGAGRQLGWVRPIIAHHLQDYPQVFSFENGISLQPHLREFDQISAGLAEVAQGLARDGVISPLIDEPYPVTPGGREAAIAVVDRAAAAYLGLRSFGQHLNGYLRDGEDILMWIGRRAQDRRIFPGALDNMVAGGLPYGVSLVENLVKECQEEAGMPRELAEKAKPVGALSYNRVAERGFRPDVLYCYDIELPRDFRPLNTDGEVEEFMLMPIAEVMDIVRNSDQFKFNCNLVIVDFLVRHGLIGPEHEEYLAIASGLRAPSGPPRSRQT